jgi:hypothetical protein
MNYQGETRYTINMTRKTTVNDNKNYELHELASCRRFTNAKVERGKIAVSICVVTRDQTKNATWI